MPKSSLDQLREWADMLASGLTHMGATSELMDEYRDTGIADPEKYRQVMGDIPAGTESAKQDMRRLMGSFAGQVYSVDPKGNVVFPLASTDKQLMYSPGFVEEAKALPDWFQPLAGALGWDYESPEWSKEANRKTDILSQAMHEKLGYGEATTPGEYALEAAGTMLGQPPVPVGSFEALKGPFTSVGKWAKGALSRFGTAGKIAGHAANAATLPARAGIEFFGPMIEATPGNYAMGTAFGTGLRSLLGGGDQESDLSLDDLIQMQDDPNLTPEERTMAEQLAEIYHRQAEHLKDTSVPPVSVPGHAKGGKITKANTELLRKIISAVLEDDLVSTSALGGRSSRLRQATDPTGLLVRLAEQMAVHGVDPHKLSDAELKDTAGRIGLLDQAPEEGYTIHDLADLVEMAKDPETQQLFGTKPLDLTGHPKPERSYYLSYPDEDFDQSLFDQQTEDILDRLQNLEDEPPEEKAKGGKIDTKSLLSLRQSLEKLLKDAEVEGTGQEMVPYEPSTEDKVQAFVESLNPVTPGTRSALEERLLAPPTPEERAAWERGENVGSIIDEYMRKEKGSLLDKPISRRTVLEGMAHLANPIKVDPLSLLGGKLEDIGARVGPKAVEALPVAKPWTVAPKLNEIWSSIMHDSDDALFPDALDLARSIPGAEKLVKAMEDWQQWLQTTKPDMTPRELSDWEDQNFNRAMEFENHLRDTAHRHGVIAEDYDENPQFSDPSHLFGHEWEAGFVEDAPPAIPRESGHELWDAATQGDKKLMKEILSWRYSPDEYDNLTTDENLDSLIRYAQAGHPQHPTPEMIVEGMTPNEWDDIRESLGDPTMGVPDLQNRYGFSRKEAQRLYDLIQEQFAPSKKPGDSD